MNRPKKVIVGLVAALAFLWVLAWTPLFDYMPRIVRSVMFTFGGVLTIVLPIIIILTAAWVFPIRRKRNVNDQK